MDKIDEKQQVGLIRQYKRLESEIAQTKDEKKARMLEREAEDIKSRVIEANLDLIYKMAKSHAEDDTQYAESLSDAQYRSIQCFYSYDPDKTDMNFRFYLAMELKRYLQKKKVNLGINTPVSFHEVCNKVNIVYNQLCRERKRYVTKNEVAEALKIDVSKVQSVLLSKNIQLNLEDKVNSDGFDGESDWHGILTDESSDTFDNVNAHELAKIMPILCENLKDAQRIAMSMSFYSPYLCRNNLDRITKEHSEVAKRVKVVEKELLSEGINPDEIKTFESFFDSCRNSADNPMPQILLDQGF
jgi:DNA-directed RNA polymerase specialized sigma subunit